MLDQVVGVSTMDRIYLDTRLERNNSYSEKQAKINMWTSAGSARKGIVGREEDEAEKQEKERFGMLAFGCCYCYGAMRIVGCCCLAADIYD